MEREVNVAKLDPIGFCKTGDEAKIASFGESAVSPTFSRKTIRTRLNPSQIDSKMFLAREERQRLREAEKQLREKGRISADRQRANDELQKLRNKIEQTPAKIDVFDEKHESESEL